MLTRHCGRAPLVVGAVIALGTLALALVGTDVLSVATAGARAEHESAVASVAPLLAQSAGTLGAAAGDSALGLQNSYFQPPQLHDSAQPGFTIDAGADQPDPFMFEQGGEYYLFTSQDKNRANVPVHEGTVVGAWGPEVDALPDLPAWAVPGIVWAPDMAQFGGHDILYFTAQLAGVSPQTSASATPSARLSPARTCPPPNRSSASSHRGLDRPARLRRWRRHSPTCSGSRTRTPGRPEQPARPTPRSSASA